VFLTMWPPLKKSEKVRSKTMRARVGQKKGGSLRTERKGGREKARRTPRDTKGGRGGGLQLGPGSGEQMSEKKKQGENKWTKPLVMEGRSCRGTRE